MSVVLEQMLQQSGYSGQVVAGPRLEKSPMCRATLGYGPAAPAGIFPAHALAESLRDLLSYQIALAKTSPRRLVVP